MIIYILSNTEKSTLQIKKIKETERKRREEDGTVKEEELRTESEERKTWHVVGSVLKIIKYVLFFPCYSFKSKQYKLN